MSLFKKKSNQQSAQFVAHCLSNVRIKFGYLLAADKDEKNNNPRKHWKLFLDLWLYSNKSGLRKTRVLLQITKTVHPKEIKWKEKHPKAEGTLCFKCLKTAT